MRATDPARRVRFGAFEADLRSGELHKHGIRIRLQDQPFQILLILLESPGELVTREDLQKRLWPADTFVDFETGLNTAVKRLRDALSDTAEKPRFIETLPRKGYRFIATTEGPSQSFPEPERLIGRRLGRYRIVERIGEGGMGVVYRARDEHLGRDVAVKILPEGTLADEAARKRFRKEAEALSKLNHPNIQTVFDFDCQDGVDFLVGEYIAGITLSDKLAAGALGEKEIGRLGTQLAEGLAAAHEQGVVHRDLKPGNLRVTPDGWLKILDFGLAKLLPTAGDENRTESLSETRVVSGTPPYMAPEQLRAEAVDARTDIHALGAVLYEMATGQRPFRGDVAPRLVEAILHRPPVSPRTLNARISPDLERIILKCLEKQPKNRYQSAKEAGVDLRRLGPPDSGPTVRPEPRVRPGWQVAAAVAGSAVLLLAALVGTNMAGLRDRMFRPAHSEFRAVAVLPLKELTGDAQQEYLADGMTDDLITHLAGIRSLRVPSRKSAMRYKGEKRSLAEIARELRVGAVVTGTVARFGGRIRMQLQLIDAASGRRRWANIYERDLTEVLFLQKEAARAVAEEAGVELSSEEIARFARAVPVNREAQLLYWKGRFHWHKGTPATPEEYETARSFFEKAIEEDSTHASAYLALASYYYMAADLGLLPGGEAYARREKAALTARALDPSSAQLASAVPSLFYEWNWPEAEREFQRAVELNPNSADLHREYSVYLRRMGRPDEAIAEAKKACEIDPLVDDFTVSLGWAYYYARRFAPAIQQFQKVLAGDKQSLAARFGLAKAFEKNDMQKEAITQWEEILAESNAEELAATVRRTYDRSGYEAAMKELWQVQLQYFRKESQEKYVSPIKFATLHALLNEKDAAFSWLEKAFAEESSRLSDLKSDADFDNLHADPRFAELVRRIGLP